MVGAIGNPRGARERIRVHILTYRRVNELTPPANAYINIPKKSHADDLNTFFPG